MPMEQKKLDEWLKGLAPREDGDTLLRRTHRDGTKEWTAPKQGITIVPRTKPQAAPKESPRLSKNIESFESLCADLLKRPRKTWDYDEIEEEPSEDDPEELEVDEDGFFRGAKDQA